MKRHPFRWTRSFWGGTWWMLPLCFSNFLSHSWRIFICQIDHAFVSNSLPIMLRVTGSIFLLQNLGTKLFHCSTMPRIHSRIYWPWPCQQCPLRGHCKCHRCCVRYCTRGSVIYFSSSDYFPFVTKQNFNGTSCRGKKRVLLHLWLKLRSVGALTRALWPISSWMVGPRETGFCGTWPSTAFSVLAHFSRKLFFSEICGRHRRGYQQLHQQKSGESKVRDMGNGDMQLFDHFPLNTVVEVNMCKGNPLVSCLWP